MTTKTITIAGKEMTLAYCYATEIAFKKLTGRNIFQFESDDQEQRVSLVYASLFSYSKSKGEDSPVTLDYLMYDSRPMEVINAANEVLKLSSEWYEVPAGEPEDDKTDDTADEKNA